jgi:hypothetical protein
MHDSGASRREIAKSRLECFCCLKIESGNQLAVDVRGRWSTSQTALRDPSHITANSAGLVSLIEQRRRHMRKLVLVAALVLVSASAEAGGTRSLTLASSDQPAAALQPNALEPNVTEAPQSFARPALRQRNSQRLQQGQGMQQGQRMRRPGPVAAAKYAVAAKVGQLKRQGAATLVRVRYALHRHGIYW